MAIPPSFLTNHFSPSVSNQITPALSLSLFLFLHSLGSKGHPYSEPEEFLPLPLLSSFSFRPYYTPRSSVTPFPPSPFSPTWCIIRLPCTPRQPSTSNLFFRVCYVCTQLNKVAYPGIPVLYPTQSCIQVYYILHRVVPIVAHGLN